MAYIPLNSIVAVQSNPSVLQIDTELPIPVTLSDTIANPTTPMIGAAIMYWDGDASVWTRLPAGSGSGITDIAGSVVSYQKPGSILATSATVLPGSVSGAVTAPPGSVMMTAQLAGSVMNVNISGSVATVGTAAANQSVSGTVQTDVRSSVAVVIIGGSVATATTPTSVMLLGGTNVIGSVGVLQSTPEWTVKSSLAGGIFPISGSVAATITNTNVNVSGSVVAFGFPTNQNVSGSVIAFQGGTNITSLVSTIPSSVIVGASIFGQLPAGTATLGSTTQPAGSITGVAGWASVTGTMSVLGTVPVTQSGTWNVSVVGNMAGTSSVYAVLSSITTISIMNANTNRKAATIHNAAGTTVFIKLGTAATTSIYTTLLNPNDYYELPGGWTGVVAGISPSNAGIINVTELT